MCTIISCYKSEQCQIKADGSEIIKGTCPATVRTIKGHVYFLPTVRWTGICLTYDTFHSDSASCPTRAALLFEPFYHSFQPKTWENPKWTCKQCVDKARGTTYDVIQPKTILVNIIRFMEGQHHFKYNFLLAYKQTNCWLFVSGPLTSPPCNTPFGQGAWWGVAGRG